MNIVLFVGIICLGRLGDLIVIHLYQESILPVQFKQKM